MSRFFVAGARALLGAGAPGKASFAKRGVGIRDTFVGGMTSSISSTLLMPATREIGYHLNQLVSNVVPDPGTTMHAYYAQRLSAQQARTLLGYQGIDWQFALPAGSGTYTVQAWKHAMDLQQPSMSESQAEDLWHQGELTTAQYADRLTRIGLRQVDIDLLKLQVATLDVGAAHQFWLQGQLTTAEFTEVMRRNGVTAPRYVNAHLKDVSALSMVTANDWYYLGYTDIWGALEQYAINGFAVVQQATDMIQRAPPFTVGEAANLYYRGSLSLDDYRKHVKASAVRDSFPVQPYIDAQRPIPPMGEIMTLASHRAWNDVVAINWGLDREIPDELLHWAQRQGYDWGEGGTGASGAKISGYHWPQLEWRSHWRLLDVGMAVHAACVLRPDRFARYLPDVPDLVAFQQSDLDDCMKAAGIAPLARPTVKAMLMAKTPLRTLFQAYQIHFRNRGWVLEKLKDACMSQADATELADIMHARRAYMERSVERSAEHGARRDAINLVVTSYVDGFIDHQAAYTNLTALGIYPNPANMMLQNAELKERHRQLAETVNAIKGDYMQGAASLADTVLLLGLAGVLPFRIAGLTREWRVLRSLEVRTASTGMILGWVKQGLMSPADAEARLTNLGWVRTDALLAIAQAYSALQTAQGRALAAQQKAAAARARQLQAAQQKLIAAAKSAAATLRRLTPLATLHKWLVDGVVTEAYVTARMTAEMYPPAVIAQYLTQWRIEAAAKSAKGVKGGKT